MISLPENKILISKSLNSFEELAAIAHAWDADFRQISSSKMHHQVLQVRMDGVLMSRGRFGCHLVQRGNTPKDLRTFALLEEDCPPVNWFGRKVGPEDLLVFPTHGEIEAISRPGFCNHTFCIEIDDLAAFFERCGGPDLSRALGSEDIVVPIAPNHLQRLRLHLRNISFNHSTLERTLTMFDAYRDKLFAILLDIFRSRTDVHPVQCYRLNRQIIRTVVDMVQQCRGERLSIEALCKAGNVPERTLNEIFRRELGISPGAFAKGYRLFGAHRELWRSDPSRVHITEVANAWGFCHLGQFAGDYRKLFAELPSETIQRSN